MLVNLELSEIVRATTTLFFIIDPFGNIAIFNSLLKKYPQNIQLKIIIRELFFALIILVLFLYSGGYFIAFFNLSQAALNVSGGVILFLIALKIIFYQPILGSHSDDIDPFIVPLAMPLIAGPSAMTFLLFLNSTKPELLKEWTISLFISWLLVAIILFLSSFFTKILGEKGIEAIEKLMGMLLIIIAVQLLLDGIHLYLQTIKIG